MLINEIISESIDLETAFPIRDFKYDSTGEQWNATAYDSRGREIVITLDAIGKSGKTLHIGFKRNDRLDVTSWGEAGRVFATVLNSLKLYLEQNPRPEIIIFLARESKRQKVYARIINRYAHNFGYKLYDIYDGKFRLLDTTKTDK